MSRKYPGNDFKKEMGVQSLTEYGQDSADITLASKSFQICVPTTGKAQMVTGDGLINLKYC